MGGRGSGRPSGLGMLTDQCHEYHSIDLAWLRRKKLLNTGRWSTLTWSRAGQVTGTIRIECLLNGVRLIYRQRRNGEDWQDVNEFVPYLETETRFGGQRQWFQCLSCGSRCRILYGGAHFRCRNCQRLKYESQYEAAYARACSQSHNIRQQLEGTDPWTIHFRRSPRACIGRPIASLGCATHSCSTDGQPAYGAG